MMKEPMVLLIQKKLRVTEQDKMTVETLISLGIMGILLYIASKMEMFNDILHEIRDMLKGRLPPPPPPPSTGKRKSFLG